MASTVVSDVSASIAPVSTKAKQDFTPFASTGADDCERLQLGRVDGFNQHQPARKADNR